MVECAGLWIACGGKLVKVRCGGTGGREVKEGTGSEVGDGGGNEGGDGCGEVVMDLGSEEFVGLGAGRGAGRR